MSRRRVVAFLAAGLLSLALSPAAYAIFGLVVFDRTNYAEAIKLLIQMERQYAQLVQTYQMIRNQYEHLKWMSKRVPVDMTSRYRTQLTPWNTSSASNAYGATGKWIDGINQGIRVLDGYLEATQPLNRYGSALNNVPADQLPRVKTNYATVELADGANVAAIETIGRLRANSRAVEGAIERLETDSLSSDPEMNTEIAVLNKMSAAQLIAVRSAQDSNKLLVALEEERLIDPKRKRDAEAQMINNHIRFMADARAVMAAQGKDASSAMQAWRMP
jgi:hypothetical protein